MLDDTCYMLGFDNLEYAAYTLILLNSKATKELLQSITFSDAKRTFTKEVLMRIDLFKLTSHFSFDMLKSEIKNLNKKYNLDIKIYKWTSFIEYLKPV